MLSYFGVVSNYSCSYLIQQINPKAQNPKALRFLGAWDFGFRGLGFRVWDLYRV